MRTPVVDPANESIFNQYTLRVERRDDLQAFLKERGIGTADLLSASAASAALFRAIWATRQAQFPEAERAAREVLSLPIYPELTHDQLDEVIGAVRAFYGR